MNEITKIQSVEQPHNVEAEQQLLGAILVNNDLYHEIANVIEPDHFYDPVHARIFEVARQRITNEHLASPVTLKVAMQSDDGLKELGGPAYLARLAGASISSGQIRQYGHIVAQLSLARQALSATENATKDILGGVDAQEAVARLHGALLALPDVEGWESSVSLLGAGIKAIENSNKAYQGEETLLRTGLDKLDRILRGLAPSDLCLLGGASSMGKTATAVEIARRVAANGKIVGFASLEMDPEQLFNRIVSAESKVPYELARAAGDMSEEQFRAWVEAAKKTESYGIHIFPRHVRDIAAIHAAAKTLKVRQGKLDLVVVDYAQLCRAPGREFRERMVNVSIGLKTMAQVLEVPVIALVQLDRRIGERQDSRPQTYDIKETSQFETDADQIVFCHWPHYYLIRKGPSLDKAGQVTTEAMADWEADKKATLHKMELIVRKNRHGRLATAEIGVDMPTNRLWNLHDTTEGFEF